jgi:predicted solute-binding protein
MSLRLACVSFLNALPYVEGFRRLPASRRPELSLDLPHRCAESLRLGEADAALVPSVEMPRLAAEEIGFGISSRNEVRSVLLLSRLPFAEIRKVAVDSSSRTSVALLKILLARGYGVRPETMSMPPDPSEMLARCEAALLIGDAALSAAARPGLRTGGLLRLDLAEAWHRMTGLPFVFAVWAVRSPSLSVEAGKTVEEALDLGLAGLDDLARREAGRCGLPAEEIADYLTRNIHFRIGSDERESLRRFRDHCGEEGLA